jgi:3-phosphoshikimate 1-carboxyvinyltransferase
MDSKTVSPARLVGGEVEIPGDKSISHRAVILGALSNRACQVDNFLIAEDCLGTVQAFRALGVEVQQEGTHLQIRGKGLDGLQAPAGPIECGNSGTTARLLMGVLTGQPFEVELHGDASLSRRPMGRVMEPLAKMGAFFLKSNDERLPIRMRGDRSVRPIRWKSPVASAQVKSAILLAGLYASGTTEVVEPSLSRDHTERMLRACGVKVESRGATVSVQGTATVRAAQFQVPGDFSSAAFFLAAGVLLAREGLIVRRVGVNPTRTGFLEVLKAMGADCRLRGATEASGEPLSDIAVKQSKLKSFRADKSLIPRSIDEIPILAVLATQAEGETVIADAQELRVKESDRLATLRIELSKMGARISEKPDGLIIQGPTPLRGSTVHSHGDHRLAMSLAVAGLMARGTTTIEDVACVNTSFPTFWSLLDQIRVH